MGTIKNLHKTVKQITHTTLDNEVFADKCIVDLDMRESGIRYGKRSFIDCEITLFQTKLLPITSEELEVAVEAITQAIIEEMESSEHFNFHKTKK